MHFSPPTLTRTWFHQGQVAGPTAGLERVRSRSVDSGPAIPRCSGRDQRTELSGIARTAALDRRPARIRHALRALRGSVLRSELYALDDSPNRDRPYTVTEALYDVREIEPDDAGRGDRLRIFFPFQIASRTTQWERGADPMTQFAFTGGHDEYGLPAHAARCGRAARPRSAAPRQTRPSEPYLSTYTVTEYARRDDAERYIVDRVARTTGI